MKHLVNYLLHLIYGITLTPFLAMSIIMTILYWNVFYFFDAVDTVSSTIHKSKGNS